MGQRVVTSLNHLDLKKVKNKNNNNANKKGEKKAHEGDHFLVTKRIHVGRNEEENRERK